MNDDIFYENDMITISLTNSVKKRIQEQFKHNDIEEFIEKEFPQDKELNLFILKYKTKQSEKIALKTTDSDYMLLVERSKDRKDNANDNYMFCFDIQKRPEIIKDDTNDFIERKCELKIPLEFRRDYYNNSNEELLDDIEEEFESIQPYKTPSLNENEEYQKWYAYLTLLEKLIDKKDFYFEANIVYTDKKAKVDISDIEDKEIREKIKKARNQLFLYYKLGEVDTAKPLHEWDEKDKRDRNFGVLKENKSNELSFDLDVDFKKKFKLKDERNTEDKEIISSSYDTNDFIVKSRQYIEESIKKINTNIIYKDKQKTKLNVAHSIKKLNISKDEESKLLDIWNKLSDKNHNVNADDIDKEYINKTLKVLEKLLSKDSKSTKFNLPSKLILRVSYFRDQFQLRTLKNGLERIQKHPLRPYLFGDKQLSIIDQDEYDNFQIEYNSKVLNEKQKEAIKKALLSQELFMIQGPPGTGKTEVISELAYQEAIRGKKVLIVSQANMAVDNAIQRLNHPSLYPVRIIRKDYEPEDGDSLPIEANIDTFYQNRIVKELSNKLKTQSQELNILKQFIDNNQFDDKFIAFIGKLGIQLPSHLDLKDHDDREDFIRILHNSENLKLIQDRIDQLNELDHFSDIQKNFVEDLTNDEKQELEEEKGYLKSNYIKNANIYGATLFETGKYSFKEHQFDTVIVDEVSKAMPPELVLPILKGEKLILVGDHKQLPPIISNELSLEDLAEETGISLDSLDFETTIFEKLIVNNPDNYVMLDTQYRMHPHIQMAINQFYIDEDGKGGLKCGLANPDIDKCHHLEDEIFKNKHLIWLKTKDSDKEERLQNQTSFFNTAEVKGIEKTLKFLDREYKKLNKRPTVGVITFYGKQLGELTKLEKKAYWKLQATQRNYSNLDLRFGTVDRFQGQEKDIIICSLVRNNKHHNVGFAKKPNRVNVAFSRAKNLLIIVGNSDNFTFGKNEKSAKMYRSIFNIAKKFGKVKGI